MKSKTKFLHTAIKKVRRGARRFARSGGFKRVFSTFWEGLKRRDVRYIGAGALAIVTVIVLLVALTGRGTTARAAQGGSSVSALSAASLTPDAGALTITPAPTPSPTPVPTPTPMAIIRGYEGPEVPDIQFRLMELGYMDYDEPTSLFGRMTEDAVKLFQRRNGLAVDGMMVQATYDALMAADALIYMASEGSEGEDIYALQSRLRELGYLETVTGYFGTDTTTAVTKFQQRNRLAVDGMIGPETKEQLYSGDVVANAISYGENSEIVKKYQARLSKLGYLTTEPDGNFGRDTVAAVKLFQEVNGLIADGYVGPETKNLLMSSSAQANAMTIGMSGSTVERIQKQLKTLGYLSSVTGYYGSDTEGAVRAFQKRNSLSIDGKVGRNTMTLLFSDKAKKAASNPPPTSGGDKKPSTPATPNYTPSEGASVELMIEVAKSKLGSRYVSGGKGPDKFDCSGFVYYCLNQAGVRQGYMTSATWHKTTKYPKISSMSDLKRGDIIVFKGHVAIALGDGTMIHAGSGEGKVYISSYNSPYWKKTFYEAYRVF